MKLNKNKGITLIALIITIIILLILAGISISALTQTGLFGRAKQAEQLSKEKQEEENKTLETYENEIDKYLGENNGETPSEPKEIKLVDKVKDGTIKIGDYVKYTPDTVTSTDKSYTDLLSNLGTYSGSSDNTASTLTPEKLNWRVLDATDDGQVRLISDKTTASKLTLKGHNGYNNAVKLLDDTCSTLYTNKQLANKVQNLKIKDITIHMKTQPTLDTTLYHPTNIYYPKITEYEEKQIVEKSTTENKIDVSSQQNGFVTGSDTSTTSSLTTTYWYKTMTEGDFLNSIYYNLFINNGNNYETYWMSSRCIKALSDIAGFDIRAILSGAVGGSGLYGSNGNDIPHDYAFRPVITLNSDIQIETTNSGDGSTAARGYAIK